MYSGRASSYHLLCGVLVNCDCQSRESPYLVTEDATRSVGNQPTDLSVSAVAPAYNVSELHMCLQNSTLRLSLRCQSVRLEDHPWLTVRRRRLKLKTHMLFHASRWSCSLGFPSPTSVGYNIPSMCESSSDWLNLHHKALVHVACLYYVGGVTVPGIGYCSHTGARNAPFSACEQRRKTHPCAHPTKMLVDAAEDWT